ncbi:protein kinase [bacterium]|nr:protein kinase [bacterium]
MIGKSLAHYEITGLLGKGGMGEVYRARDTKLKRDVALKILPAELAADPARLERFQREAEAVAGVNHPNIVTLYSVEKDAGTHFLTMELVEGDELDHLLPPDGLGLPKVFEIGTAIADALAAAHGKGIVHRDLKPANVMITTDGHVKVLDFGLAKLAETGPSTPDDATLALGLTREGAVLGTVPYMSPEQLRGRDVDHRSDIFSLGVLLYELSAGRRPFLGDNSADLTSSILKEAPPPLTELKPELPRHLGRILAHCLEKEPKDRYQSVLDIRNELRGLRREVESGVSVANGPLSGVHAASQKSRKGLWIGIAATVLVLVGVAFFLGREEQAPPAETAATTPAISDKSIAVMAFVDMSPRKDQEYFSDGIAEELLNLLANIPELKVISRTSAFSFKGKDVPLKQIGEELGVAHILEGSVRKAGNEIRITAQLIEAESDTHLWSETYDRELRDVFALQDEIAADVVDQLKVTLLGDAPKSKEVDPKAYALFLDARQAGRLGSREGYERAIALCEQALAIDPGYADACVALAGAYVNQAGATRPRDEGFALARNAAQKALTLDPDHAKAHSLLGWIATYYDGDLRAAARHFQKALELEPNNLDIISNSAPLLGMLGRYGEEIAVNEYFAERDPLNSNSYMNLGSSYFAARRWSDAVAQQREALRLSPDKIGPHIMMGYSLLMMGDPKAALDEFARTPVEDYQVWGKALVFHVTGRQEDAEAQLQDYIDRWGREYPDGVASLYAAFGQIELAFEWLETWRQAKERVPIEPSEPSWDSLRDDPRWHTLLEEIGRSPEELDAIEFEVKLPGRRG